MPKVFRDFDELDRDQSSLGLPELSAVSFLFLKGHVTSSVSLKSSTRNFWIGSGNRWLMFSALIRSERGFNVHGCEVVRFSNDESV